MATTQDRDIKNDTNIALRHLVLTRSAVAASQSALKIGAVKPGYPFRIMGVQEFAGTVTGTADYDLRIGTTSALAGRKCSAAVAGGSNAGDGTVGTISADDDAEVGDWVLECTAAASNAGTFSVTSPAGVVHTAATVGVAYNGAINFTIADGTADFEVGDTFTITVRGGRTPTAATRADVTLAGTSDSELEGDEDDVINLHATTASGAAFAELGVVVTVRPLGLRGDA